MQLICWVRSELMAALLLVCLVAIAAGEERVPRAKGIAVVVQPVQEEMFEISDSGSLVYMGEELQLFRELPAKLVTSKTVKTLDHDWAVLEIGRGRAKRLPSRPSVASTPLGGGIEIQTRDVGMRNAAAVAEVDFRLSMAKPSRMSILSGTVTGRAGGKIPIESTADAGMALFDAQHGVSAAISRQSHVGLASDARMEIQDKPDAWHFTIILKNELPFVVQGEYGITGQFAEFIKSDSTAFHIQPGGEQRVECDPQPSPQLSGAKKRQLRRSILATTRLHLTNLKLLPVE